MESFVRGANYVKKNNRAEGQPAAQSGARSFRGLGGAKDWEEATAGIGGCMAGPWYNPVRVRWANCISSCSRRSSWGDAGHVFRRCVPGTLPVSQF